MTREPHSIASEDPLATDDGSVERAFAARPGQDRNRAFELAELERRLFGTETVEPFRVGRFTVMEKLGAGGMGVVYAAFDPQLERKIAVKFLRSDLQGVDEQGSARLLREAQALARLGHPNVVSVFDVGAYEGGVYVAMEFVRGSSLSAWVKEARPTWQEILDAYLQAGEGLAAAHRAGIVHRDFKPDNALRGEDGRVRVLDFGLAAPTDDELADALDQSRLNAPAKHSSDTGTFSDPLTRTGAVMGTPLYMSPEQHRGERADARSDQFALCVALWVALFGERPFAGETMAELSSAVIQGELRPFPKAPRLPKRVRSAIRRGLQAHAQDRFDRIEDLLRELDERGRRRRGVILGAIAVGLAATIGGALAWHLRGDAAPSVCVHAQARIESAWNEVKVEEARSRYAKTDAATAWTEVHRQLERQIEAWRVAQADLCDQKEIDLEQLSCIEWRLQEIETFSELLLQSSADTLYLVAPGLSALVPPAACTDARALSIMQPPARDPTRRADIQRVRTEIVRANVLHKSGRHDEALKVANEVVNKSRALDDAAVESEGLLLLGEVQAQGRDRKNAEATLRMAIRRAEAGGHDQVRARGLGVLIGVVGFGLGEPTEELEDRFESVRARIGDLPSPAVVDYQLAVTMVRIGHGRLEAAHTAARAALEEAKRLNLELGFDLELVRAHAQLGLSLTLLGRYDEARPVLDYALDNIDPHHPQSVRVFGICGIHRGFAGEDQEAVEFFKRALALEATREMSQPHYRALVGTYMASSLDRLGATDKAILLQKTSIAQLKRLWGEEHGAVGRAYHQFGTTLADNAKWVEARAAFEQSLSIWTKTHGLGHRAVAHPETGLARVYLHENKNEEALALLEAALPKLSSEAGHPPEDARTYFHLARALVRTGGDRARAESYAQRAEELLLGLGPGYARDRDAIASWRALLP